MLSLSTKLAATLGGGSFNLAFATPDDPTSSTARWYGAHVVVNAASSPINPATEDTLQSTLSLLQSGTLKVTWSSALPVSVAALPLPTGAATAAKQPALGVAGTASADVLTVQGVAAMTPIKTDGSGTIQPVSGTVTATQGGAPWSYNQTQILGVAVAVGTGASNAGTQRVAISSDSTVGLSGTLPAFAATPTVNIGTAGGLALDATAQSILSVLQGQRAETLWTDDTGSYVVRVDKGGAIAWADLSGNVASAPGTGARPAAGTTVLLSRSSFQATASGTGYATGDFLDHFVTTDPASGAVIGNFWVNLTTGIKLASAPANANITPVAALPTNAATLTGQQAIVSALTGMATAAKQPAPGTAGAPSADILTVQGAANATPLPTKPSANASRVSVTGALSALNATAIISVDGMSTLGLQISGTWAGTVTLLGSMDDGASYPIQLGIKPMGTAGGATVSGITANGNWDRSTGGLTHIQVKMTAFTSGSASVLLIASNGGKFARVDTPANDPLPVVTPTPAAPVWGQVKIVATGTAVALPSNALVNGIVVKASVFNQAQSKTAPTYTGAVGGAGVTTLYDASTNSGYPLAPGEAASFAVANSSAIYVNGTAGDVFSFEGN